MRNYFCFEATREGRPSFAADGLSERGSPGRCVECGALVSASYAMSRGCRELISGALSNIFSRRGSSGDIGSLERRLVKGVERSLGGIFSSLRLASVKGPLIGKDFCFAGNGSRGFRCGGLSTKRGSTFSLLLSVIVGSMCFGGAMCYVSRPRARVRATLRSELLGRVCGLIPSGSRL